MAVMVVPAGGAGLRLLLQALLALLLGRDAEWVAVPVCHCTNDKAFWALGAYALLVPTWNGWLVDSALCLSAR